MKPKAIFKRIPDHGEKWFLLNWWTIDGQMLLAPSLGALIDSARCAESMRSGNLEAAREFAYAAKAIESYPENFVRFLEKEVMRAQS